MPKCDRDCFNCPYPDCILDNDPRIKRAEHKREYMREWKKQLSQERKAHYAEQANECTRRRRQERREQGLCPYCGRKPAEGRIRCQTCQQRDNERRKERRREMGIARREDMDGIHLCAVCGKRPPKAVTSVATTVTRTRPVTHGKPAKRSTSER